MDLLHLELQGFQTTRCRFWALNPGPLEEEYVPLTGEPSPAPVLPYCFLDRISHWLDLLIWLGGYPVSPKDPSVSIFPGLGFHTHATMASIRLRDQTQVFMLI